MARRTKMVDRVGRSISTITGRKPSGTKTSREMRFLVSSAQAERIRNQAEDEGRTVSNFCAYAIERYLDGLGRPKAG